jgi:ribonuclease P protein component
MLNKQNRVTKAKEFTTIFKRTKPVYTENFVFRFLKKNDHAAPVRFGFVISNKVEKLAANRNLIKRRLRAAARELISSVETGYDVVVVVKSLNVELTYDMVKQQLTSAIKKNSFFNEKNIDQNNRNLSKNPLA